MLILPLRVEDAPDYTLVVILEKDSMDRLRLRDPAEIDIGKIQPPFSQLRLSKIVIGYLKPEDREGFFELAKLNNIHSALKLISSGWRYRPEDGDNDEPYSKVASGTAHAEDRSRSDTPEAK